MNGDRWFLLLALCSAATASEFEKSHFNCSAPDLAYPTLACSVGGVLRVRRDALDNDRRALRTRCA